jgi:uncharacterized glyoxalase superfamily protein PhnB
MNSLTPVLYVEEVEPCLGFWLNLGFEKTIEVPEGNRLGFAAVRSGNVEVMYQSRASLSNDHPPFAQVSFEKTGFGLYIQVADLDVVLPKLEGSEVLVPERKTFYGAREIGVRAPCGSTVMFAQMMGQ